MKFKTTLFCTLLSFSLIYPMEVSAADPFADLPDPTRYKQTPKKVVKKIKRKPLILQSTLISKGRSYAIINGKQVAIGERVNGATLLAINPFNVLIESRGQQKTLQLISTDVVHKQGRTINED